MTGANNDPDVLHSKLSPGSLHIRQVAAAETYEKGFQEELDEDCDGVQAAREQSFSVCCP